MEGSGGEPMGYEWLNLSLERAKIAAMKKPAWYGGFSTW